MGTLIRDFVRTLSQQWRARRADQNWLAGVGLVLIGSGLFHLGVWAVDGGPWAGPVSWRKPIVFGLSVGITSLSLAWVVGLLEPTRWHLRWARVYAVAMVIEVGLITLQTWRGVASHFNLTTPLDNAIFTAMGLAIAVAAVPIVWWTVLVLRRGGLAPDARAAAGLGMLLLDASMVIGQFMAIYGSIAVGQDPGADPAVFGAAGLLKVPHAVSLHAIQALPLLGWLLAYTGLEAAQRARAIQVAGAGYVGVLAFTLLQAFAGRAPADVTDVSALVGVAGLLVLAAPFVVAFARLVLRGRSGVGIPA